MFGVLAWIVKLDQRMQSKSVCKNVWIPIQPGYCSHIKAGEYFEIINFTTFTKLAIIAVAHTIMIYFHLYQLTASSVHSSLT